jgi:hypothetical protein
MSLSRIVRLVESGLQGMPEAVSTAINTIRQTYQALGDFLGEEQSEVVPRKRKRGMSVLTANEKGHELFSKMRAKFALLSEREQARMIGCSWETWSQTSLYQLLKERKAKAKPETTHPHGPPVQNLSARTLASIGEEDESLQALTNEEKDKAIQALAKEQEAEADPSPLEPDLPDQPRKVNYRKRL